MTVSEIVALVGGRVAGDPSLRITGANGLREARKGEVSFVREARYLPLLDHTRASAVFLAEEVQGYPFTQIIVDQPEVAFLLVLQRLGEHALTHPQGVHPAAIVGNNVALGREVALDAFVRIADDACIGDRVVLYAGAYVGRSARVGADTVVYPNATIREYCEIGERCILHANAVIGSDGFGFVPVEGRWVKVPQVGRVVLGDDVEVGSNTAIDRATFGETRIGQGTKIDNLVQIGHNVRIGEHCVIAGKVGIAGSAVIGSHVRIGAQAGVNGHIEVGDGATIGARAGVTGSVPAGATVSGFPAIDHSQQRRVMVAQTHLPEMGRRLRQVERRMDALEQQRHE
ncbi:MAG TPA: UDP-3-O-(3-hydroxymyristoyl)glucosamine N-acyltransferase [Candidatus Hydrogenedentes bacterium]|nr:UDP-3-O-(3-hydroxymyristoyl)glucosamine N-acyltransferase [Candidatus Hydrogenedentota bacterium]